jgi:hypothetical protein
MATTMKMAALVNSELMVPHARLHGSINHHTAVPSLTPPSIFGYETAFGRHTEQRIKLLILISAVLCISQYGGRHYVLN